MNARITCISSASRLWTLRLLLFSIVADMYMVSPGRYTLLSVLADTDIGPVAQQRQHTVFSSSAETGVCFNQSEIYQRYIMTACPDSLEH